MQIQYLKRSGKAVIPFSNYSSVCVWIFIIYVSQNNLVQQIETEQLMRICRLPKPEIFFNCIKVKAVSLFSLFLFVLESIAIFH